MIAQKMAFAFIAMTLFGSFSACAQVAEPDTSLIPDKSTIAALSESDISPPDMAVLSGKMHALSEMCNSYTAKQLQKMKNQQRAALSTGGFSLEAYDEAFAKSYDAVRAKIATMNEADKKETCRKLKGMAGMR